MPYVWLPNSPALDVHGAFRIAFATSAASTVITIVHVGVTWYNLWLDEKLLAEGPTRFQKTPMYDQTVVTVAAGKHVVAVQVHSAGVQTRLQLESRPCLFCEVSGDCEIATFRCRSLSNTFYESQWRRLSGLLGWAENCTIDMDLLSWKQVGFDDSAWMAPWVVSYPDPSPLSDLCSPAGSTEAHLSLVGSGSLVERFGYANDDPPARLSLRALAPSDLDYGPPQGRWWRFDAGACRLLRPVFSVKAKPGTVFEICYSQALIDGKASPYHPLCGTPSCYMDRYTIGSTISESQDVTICPLEPRGCRFIELHAVCDDNPEDLSAVQLTAFSALFRGYKPYLASPTGAFDCSDSKLATIWQVGVLTTSVCVEDTCIDGPCRERGQWTGDSVAVTLPNLISSVDNLGPIRVVLGQTSDSADANGVVSGNCPNNVYLTDYALLWVEGAARYLSASGDIATSTVLKSRASRQLDYFLSSACYSPTAGFTPPSSYGLVVDWGYSDNGAFAPTNMCLNALLVSALAAMVQLCLGVGDAAAAQKYGKAQADLSELLMRLLGVEERKQAPEEEEGWVTVHLSSFDPSKLGFHAAALCLRAGLLGGYEGPTAAFLKQSLLDMFPNNPNAPRLSDPGKRSLTGFYTPYFQTFTFDALFRCGEADFVLDQYRKVWGWALSQSSTWLEVFDPRWEAVHSWGGCPTWQLSQFLLGFVPRFDVGPRHFDLCLKAGSVLSLCRGTVPTRDPNRPLLVTWQRLNPSSVQLKLTVTRTSIAVKGWPTDPSTYVTLTPASYTVTVPCS